jgi:neopullulanase
MTRSPSSLLRAPLAWLLLPLALGLNACATSDSPGVTDEGATERECRDGADNDGDGAIDCADSGCASFPICALGIDVSVRDASTDAAADVATPDAGVADAGADTTTPDASVDADTPDATADAGTDATGDTGVDATRDSGVDAGPTGNDIRSCSTRIEYRPGSASSVQIAGPFTDWAAGARDLNRDGDLWWIELELPAGEHPYKFITDGVWDWDGQAEVPSWITVDFYTQWVGGSENRNVIVGDCNVPTLRTIAASGGPDGVQATVQFVRAADGAPIDPASVSVTVGGVDATPNVDPDTGVITITESGLAPGKHSIRITARDTEGRAQEEDVHFIPLWVEATPWQWEDATMYFVFTDRFRDGDFGAPNPIADPIAGVPAIANYQGGDFLGVIQSIEEGYFDALGVDLLWLSPVTENPEGSFLATDGIHPFTGFHGYWPTHARRIEFRWGDAFGDADSRFREMIAAAHARGIRVLLDIPLNHVHSQHEYVTQFPSWFSVPPCPCTSDPGPCNWDSLPGTLECWFTDYLPDLQYRNHEIVRQMAEDVEWLVTEYDVDAFRIDAAKHMDHVIMRRISKRLEERFEQGGASPFYLVGETYTGDSGHGLIMDYVNPYELDAQYDFPLLYPIRDVFAFDSRDFAYLSERRQLSEDLYGDAYPLMSPFLGNHDIPRFSTYLFGGLPDPWSAAPDPMEGPLSDATWNVVNRMSMGFAYVLTQPGIPLIYYGDEIGLYGGADPDNRRMMNFEPFLSDPQAELLGRVQQIGQARRDHRALRRGVFRELWVDRGNGGNLHAYARDAGGGDVAIIAMNKGEGGSRQVPIPAELGLDGVTLVDALGTDRTLRVTGGNATITLAQWEYVIFVRDDR